MKYLLLFMVFVSVLVLVSVAARYDQEAAWVKETEALEREVRWCLDRGGRPVVGQDVYGKLSNVEGCVF